MDERDKTSLKIISKIPNLAERPSVAILREVVKT